MSLEDNFLHIVQETALAALPAADPALRAWLAAELTVRRADRFGAWIAVLPQRLSAACPVPAAAQAQLGAAHLLAWCYAYHYDRLLDGEGRAAALIPAQPLFVASLGCFAALGGLDRQGWARFALLQAESAAAYQHEALAQARGLLALSDGELAAWTPALLGQRCAPILFGVEFQARQAGHDPAPWLAACTALLVARQIADDASDWAADLAAGRVSFVLARLLLWLRQQGRAADLIAPEQLAVRQAAAAPFWAEMAAIHQAQCAIAAEQFAPWPPLAALVAAEEQAAARLWPALARQRAEWLDSF